MLNFFEVFGVKLPQLIFQGWKSIAPTYFMLFSIRNANINAIYNCTYKNLIFQFILDILCFSVIEKTVQES